MVKIFGKERHLKRLNRMSSRESQEIIGRHVYAAASLIEIEAEISITAGSVSGKNHVVSAPGSPPNRDSGVLDGNIESARTGLLTAEVSSNAEYSAALEFGTSKMQERPYMRPAVAKKRQEAVELIGRGVREAVRKAGS